MATLLDESHQLPDPATGEDSLQEGLIAVGGDLSPGRILAAYRSGIFPWSVNPLTWWSPDPRAVFPWDAFHISRSLKRRLRLGTYHITFDQAFDAVIAACADRQDESTWISQEFIAAYTQLHRLGYAHSVEAWHDESLVGGLYGIAIGGLFAGESMFHRKSDASKVALHTLHQQLHQAGFAVFDIQMLTPVTAQLGACEIPRSQYLSLIKTAVHLPCEFPSTPTR